MTESNLGIDGQLQEKCDNVKDWDNAETQFLAIAAALVPSYFSSASATPRVSHTWPAQSNL